MFIFQIIVKIRIHHQTRSGTLYKLIYRGIFYPAFFLCACERVHPITKMWTKRVKMNFLFKVSYLNSNFTLTLGYHNLALNPVQHAKSTAAFKNCQLKNRMFHDGGWLSSIIWPFIRVWFLLYFGCIWNLGYMIL